MRAALCRSYGGPEVVEIADVAAPELAPGTARVRVQIGAVNFPDVLVIADTYQVSAPLACECASARSISPTCS